MNDNHEAGSRDNERAARQALEPLREWGGSDRDTPQRLARRGEVNARLAAAIKREQDARVPLWRRRVAIPLPAAAGFLLAFTALAALAIGDRARPGRNAEQAMLSGKQDTLETPRKDPDLIDSTPAQGTQPAMVAALDCQILYREERIVVAGLGTIKSVQTYQCESE